MFVVAEDFNRQPFNLIGLDSLDTGEFDDFVSYHEEENLRKLLGNLFYDAFVTGLIGTPELFKAGNYGIGDEVVYLIGNVSDVYICIAATAGELPTDAAFWTKQAANRWVRLKFGDEYLYYGRPQKWYGFNRLVVRLIYGLWMTYTYDKPTAQGVVVTANENSTTTSPSKRIARAMNEYARLCAGDFPNVLDPNYMIWPELENSLFGYLYMNSDTWEDLMVGIPGFNSFKAYLAYSFGWPGKTNVFGI
jgi:hypothetical protein